MMSIEALIIDYPIQKTSQQRLNGPNSCDDSNVDVSKMTIIHGQKYTTLYSKEKAALQQKSQQVKRSQFSIYNYALRIPAGTFLSFILTSLYNVISKT
jgi:hypothetical protein